MASGVEGGVAGDGSSSSSNSNGNPPDAAAEPRGRLMDAGWLGKLRARGREGCFLLALVFTCYAALQNSPMRTQKTGVPKRFFPWTSMVNDYYFGDIDEAFQWILESDLTFVMFYAPWDASSMDMRWEFNKAAKYFQDQVRFIAVNCWWPEGECRRHFRRIQAFPVLMAFPGAGRGIQYRGPNDAVHMVRFLENVIQPLRSVFSFRDLVRLQSRHDTVVVAYFDFEGASQPSGFTAFHNAAMKALEKDPHQGICFAVVSQKQVAHRLGLRLSKSVLMFRYNETWEYSKPVFRSDLLLEWIFGNQTPVVQWLAPPRTKSLLLSAVLEGPGSALIMFTPNNPLSPTMPYFDLLREVALDYYNCNDSQHVRLIIHESSHLRQLQWTELSRTRKECETRKVAADASGFEILSRNGEDSVERPDPCCRSVLVSKRFWKKCNVCVYEPLATNSVYKRHCDLGSSTTAAFYVLHELNSVCFELPPLKFEAVIRCRFNTDKFSQEECSTDHGARLECDGPRYEGLDDKMRTLFEDGLQKSCRRWKLGQHFCDVPFPSASPVAAHASNFTGLGCRTNNTLKFITLDALQYGTFFGHLGLNASRFQHKTAVMIHNTRQEVQHLLGQLVTKHNLVEFIWNFTHGNLGRFLRSSPEVSACASDGSDDSVCLLEVTSDSFMKVIMAESQDVVLLYYAPWCGFCAGLAHVYLTVARYFRPLMNLTFARINGDRNDLPWEYTVENYPTLIFFPAHRKSESSAFPEDLPITVPNLVHFVLANLDKRSRLRMALTLCTSPCIARNRRRALSHRQTLLRELRMLFARRHHVQRALNYSWQEKSLDVAVAHQLEESLNLYKCHVEREIQQARLKLFHLKLLHRALNPVHVRLGEPEIQIILRHFNNFLWDFNFRTNHDSLTDSR